MECWAAFTTETEKIRHSRPRPSSPGNPLPPRCCWGLDTFSKRSAAAQTLATLISPKPFPSAGLTPHMVHPWVVSPEPSREGDVTKQVNPTRARWNSESQPQTGPLPRQEGLRTRMELLSSLCIGFPMLSPKVFVVHPRPVRPAPECVRMYSLPSNTWRQGNAET